MDATAEIRRQLANLIRIGTIAEVDHAAARARFADGDLLTDWLPWLSPRAGTTRDWDPPTTGEQALLLAPSGETRLGILVTGIYRDAHPAPDDDPATHRRVYPDGAVIEYDHAAHHLRATIPGSAQIHTDASAAVDAGDDVTVDTPTQVVVTAPQSIFNGDVQVNGNFGIAGGYTATVDADIQFAAGVESNGHDISSSHRHSGVESGGSTTDEVV
ncbi:phage baseplate assembly protein V [Salinisphaera sp. USBA-960]|nr:phage baseplate assembly protein V [Salifodinibacter halophilus]NNC25305.1 phage baseplate assembly protein V [Salifodinibacter halophilus]